MSNPLFDLLLQSEKASQISLDQQGRSPYPTIGVVVDNLDPENRRRVKIATQDKPQTQSDWIRRITPYPSYDPPLPAIGQTVLVFYADGLESNGFYLVVTNDANPALSKGDKQKDLAINIVGDHTVTVEGEDIKNVEGSSTVQAGSIEAIADGQISNSCDGDFNVDSQSAIMMQALSTLTILAGTYLKLQAGANYIELGSDGNSTVSGNWVINLAGSSLSFINASSISINSKQIATVSALDSDGDVLVNKGW